MDDARRACAAADAVLRRRGLPPVGRGSFRAGFRLPLRSWFVALGVPPDDTTAAVREWNAEMARRPARLAAGARDTVALMRASGMRLGVVSAASGAALREDLARPSLAPIAAHFDFVIGDVEEKRTAFLELAGGAPRRCVYVGDTEYDVLEARAAGIRVVGYGSGYRPAAELAAAGADHVIVRLSELPGLLREG